MIATKISNLHLYDMRAFKDYKSVGFASLLHSYMIVAPSDLKFLDFVNFPHMLDKKLVRDKIKKRGAVVLAPLK